MKKLFCLFACLVFYTIAVFGQQKAITGQITDDKGNPIPFASVLIKSSKLGSSADQLGNFSIKAKAGDILVVSSQGFNSKEITVGTQATLSISLTMNTAKLTPTPYATNANKQIPRRYTYGANEYSVNVASVTEAAARIGGDSPDTKIWWDK